jgi:alanyl-tRNA synthetase
MAIVLRTVTAHAQGMGRSQKGELKKEHQAKKKEDQEKRRRLRTHTKTHLKVYPNLVKSLTPWKTMR